MSTPPITPSSAGWAPTIRAFAETGADVVIT